MQLIVLPWQWAKHLVRSSCFCIFVMNRAQIIQTSCTWSNLHTIELLQCLTIHLYVISWLLCCVKINTIFPLFSRPNPLKVIPTRLNATLSSTSCPRRLWFLPLYKGLAVLQSPTMVSLTYCEITEIRGIHWYLSSKNLHPQQILKLNLYSSFMKSHAHKPVKNQQFTNLNNSTAIHENHISTRKELILTGVYWYM